MGDDDVPFECTTVPIVHEPTQERDTISISTHGDSDPIQVVEEALDTGIPEVADRAGAAHHDDNWVVDTNRLHEFGFGLEFRLDDENQSEHESEATAESNERTSSEPDTLLRESADLYERKNEDYGEAWRLAGEMIALWAGENDVEAIDPSDPQQMVALNLYVQRLHKIIRGLTQEFGDPETEPNNEAVAESHQDEGVYAHLHAHHALSAIEADVDD